MLHPSFLSKFGRVIEKILLFIFCRNDVVRTGDAIAPHSLGTHRVSEEEGLGTGRVLLRDSDQLVSVDED